MTDLRIDYDAALQAYDEHGGKHTEALRAALDAGMHLAVIQMQGIEEYADARDDQRDRIIATLDDALGEGSCVERDVTDAIRELAKERDDAEKRGAARALRVEAARGLEAAEEAGKRDSPFTDFAVHLMRGLAGELARRADAIESGEVTLP